MKLVYISLHTLSKFFWILQLTYVRLCSFYHSWIWILNFFLFWFFIQRNVLNSQVLYRSQRLISSSSIFYNFNFKLMVSSLTVPHEDFLWVRKLWLCLALTFLTPVSQNGQTHSNNSSVNCRRIVWVCVDHFGGLACKGLKADPYYYWNWEN